jgi:dTDP-glucose 4,6-dehydratase
LVRAWGETFKLPVVTSNCSNNYGPWQFPEKLIPLMIAKMRTGQPLPVYGKGENIRDWLFVEDHARALALIVAKGRPGDTYNIGGLAERRNIDLVRKLCALMDARFPEAAPHEQLITYVTDRPGHDLRYAIDATKVERELGWVPAETLDTGLAKTLDWYMGHEEWWRGRLTAGYDGRRLGLVEGAQRS